MKTPDKGNPLYGFTRREFLGNCAACFGGIVYFSAFGSPALCLPSLPAGMKEKSKIRLIFAYPDPEKPNWPNIGYDFNKRIQELQNSFHKQCPDIAFLPAVATTGQEKEAHRILSADDEVDGYIVYLVGCLWGNMTETIAASGKPTIIVDDLYAGSGEFLTSYASARRAGNKVIAVSSSNFEDVVAAVRCFACLKKLQSSTVLVVGRDTDREIIRTYGTQMKKIEFQEINDLYRTINSSEAKKWADRWISEAEKVIEPSREDIEKSATMYLAMVGLMEKYNAPAITVNCLGGIYSGNMVEAYPCLGFMQLDNDGYVGACEADQRSAITKLLMTYLVGRPGFISDPVIDTSENQIIYVHCIAPTRVFGPDGPSNPYHIRDHSEDRKGACNRSLMPVGEMTTTILFDHNKKQVIFHQGRTVANVDDDKACRTKLAVEVKGDVFKLLRYWDEWGWHRVTFFGDLKRPVFDIASLLGFEVVEEA